MGINNDTSNLLYVTNSCNSSTRNTWLNCEEEQVESKKKNTKEKLGPNRKLKHLGNAQLD